MTDSYYKCIAFDIEKFYGKWKYFYHSIFAFIVLLVISYVPNKQMWFEETVRRRNNFIPISFKKSILMSVFNVSLETSLLILFITFFCMIIFIYFNSSNETDYTGLENKVLVGYVSFNDENIEIKRDNNQLSILINYKNILSYNKNYYKEIGHYYWIELKEKIFYLSFYNHNFAAEIEEMMNNKLKPNQS